MTDYVVTAGRSSTYPLQHYGAHFIGSRATFCLERDFSGLDANVLAIPNIGLTVLSANAVKASERFYGMHIASRSNDSTAALQFATVRSHDLAGGKARWQYIEPSDNAWDFADLDLWVNTHYSAGRDLIFTLFGTPQWASARPTEVGAYGSYNPGIQAEPTDMTKWDRFCTAVAQRYLGKIKYYEVWNEPNWHNDGTGPGVNTDCYFTGTFATLAQMVRRANQAIKAVDPFAKIISPPITAWSPTAGQSAETYFTGMMAASDGVTGVLKDWIDIIGVHLYVPGNDTTKLPGMIDRINAAKTTAGISGTETWDTESGPISPDMSGLTDAQARAFFSRSLLTAAAKGIARTIAYQFDNATMGMIGRSQIIYRCQQIISLVQSGAIRTVSGFSDGRIGYYTNAGLTII